jgi:hypothetical protein
MLVLDPKPQQPRRHTQFCISQSSFRGLSRLASHERKYSTTYSKATTIPLELSSTHPCIPAVNRRGCKAITIKF